MRLHLDRIPAGRRRPCFPVLGPIARRPFDIEAARAGAADMAFEDGWVKDPKGSRRG